MPTTETNGIELGYIEQGSGEPLILIGGYTMVKEAWQELMNGLSDRFRVIAIDNRGVGESTVPDEPFTIADMAADAAGLVDALALDKAHLFGVSMGGLICQVLALDYPGRVIKVVLGCTTHGGRHAVQPAKEVMAVLAKSSDPNTSPEEAVRMGLPINYSDRFLKEEPERVEELVGFSLQNRPTPKGGAGQFKALSVFNVRDRLGEIDCPVLVVTGSQDKMMPPENSKLLAEGIPGAELHVLDGPGHGFYNERPDQVTQVLIDFFTK